MLIGSYESEKYISDFVIWNEKAYIAVGGNSLEIIDIEDTKNPKLLSNITANSRYIAFDSNQMIVYLSNGKMSTIDVSNPYEPIMLNSITIQRCESSDQIFFYDNLLFVGIGGCDWSFGRFVIYDVSNPESPQCETSLGPEIF